MKCKAGLFAGILTAAAFGMLEAQTRTIIGRVTDQITASPISYGRVTVEGLGISDNVRPDGVFVVRVPLEGVTLLVEIEGYQTRSVDLPVDQQIATIAVMPLGYELDEVTVAARGRQSVTAAATTVSGEDLSRVPAQSLEQALQGKVPGADIQQNSGTPGGDLQLRLRGVTTILGSVAPLYVLDGTILSSETASVALSAVTAGQDFVPSRVADLNPNDIESIEILKGASATTRYGSRGSNGVVIITTKRGGRIPNL
jgi:TonB-dependent SusC/RagA subfamily outer membrane receptor